ncbi:MAG: 4Fe-4S dicluster domain-containing protein [Candidatus Aminicenantes bacterium]|nr:4Fe-4S dicluster domain-containing protein [Candidatus Aminicenantes bacterium]
MARPDLKFGKKLKKYGAVDFNACYNCGTCTAVCALASETDSFPREMVRYSVLGLDEEIKGSLKPWLCYYCGECSTYCPQEAQPGELMMSLRRYLISRYDWTGLSGLLCRSLAAYAAAFLAVVAGLMGLFFFSGWGQKEWMHYGHLFEMAAIGGVFAFILLPNIVRMWYFTVWKRKKTLRMKTYLLALPELLLHMFTQKRTLSCNDERDNTLWWFEHLVLVLGYLGLLFATVFLDWFASTHPVVVAAGYVLSAVVFVVTFDFVIRRIRKRSEKSVFSHPSDWFFVIWLFLMGISAFGVRLLVDLGALAGHFWLYLLHLTVLVQWALIIVPFGKWTHFLYRSFAMYFDRIVKMESPAA